MTGMDELVTWLRAQLDDDERVARQMMAEPGGFYIEAETVDVNVMTVGAHVYRWTPKRVLTEVEAKRRILDWAVRAVAVTDADCYQLGVADVVRMLALPYAGKPGYRGEWRP